MIKIILLITIFLLATVSCSKQQESELPLQGLRIISMVPSLTEVLFELQLGKNLVGVSKFSQYPDSARNIEKVGGLFDANIEKIFRLNPTTIIIDESRQFKNQLLKLNLKDLDIVSLKTETIDDIFKNIRQLGDHFNRKKMADSLMLKLSDSLNFYQNLNRDSGKKVLCVINRSPGEIAQIYVAGKETFINEVIEKCGLINSVELSGYPQINSEFIYQSPIDYIFEIRPEIPDHAKNEIVEEWEIFYERQNKKTKTFVFNEDYMVLPGPRVYLALKEISKALAYTISREKYK